MSKFLLADGRVLEIEIRFKEGDAELRVDGRIVAWINDEAKLFVTGHDLAPIHEGSLATLTCKGGVVKTCVEI